MINIYDSKETDFENNGIGILSEALMCEIRRELNGVFYLELEYPLYDKKELYLQLKGYNIIKAPTPNGEQLFRIQRTEKRNETVYVYAIHIIFDLSDNIIPDTNIVGRNRLQAVQQLLNNTITKHKFNAIGTNSTLQNNARVVRKSPVEAIFSKDGNSIITRWGGEFDFDNFNINCLDFLGNETNEVISYGKNLIDIKEELDMNTVYTRIIPQGFDGLLLPEYFIDSPLINNYHQPIIRHIKFEDVKIKEADEESPAVTEIEAFNTLRHISNELFNLNHVDEPFFNYTIEFENLSNTEEYKDFKRLIKYNLGDKIIVKHKDLNLHLHSRIIAYLFDAITQKYINIELGKVKQNINMVINKALAQVEFTKQKIEMEVKSLDEKLGTKIEITENGIKENIKNTKEGLETKIIKTAEGLQIDINKKVNDKDLATKITANYEAVKIAWNTISQYIEFINGKLYAKQPDGSYFELGIDGIKKHTSNGNFDLHYLTWVGSCTTAGTVGGTVYLNLPADFKNKDWKSYTSIYDSNNSGGQDECLQKIIGFTSTEDKINNRVEIRGYTTTIDRTTGTIGVGSIGLRVMVTA